MKNKFLLSLFLLILLAGSFLPAGLARATSPAGPPWYIRGDFNGWAAPGELMYDDGTHGDVTAGDLVFTILYTVASAGRAEWKATDGTNWYPPSNAWLVTTVANQQVTFTFDANTYNDGWAPSQNIANVQDGVTTWTAIGDWQGWSNDNPATAMHPYAGGLYAYTGVIATAGTHQYKVCRTGTWDCIGPEGASGGRSKNTANLDVSTTVANQRVLFLADTAAGRIRAVQLGVMINEFASKGTEFVELYNPLTSAVDISDWTLVSAVGGMNYTFPSGTSIPAGGYLSYASGATQDNNGDIITLTNAADIVVDTVGWGDSGGAPSPHTNNSTGRAPNGVDTDDWARDWNLDTTPTNGSANDQPAANLGSSLIVNEVRLSGGGGNGYIELYNPTTAPIEVTNWRYSDGDVGPPLVVTSTPGVSIPAGGFFYYLSGTSLSNRDEVYLFQPDYVRVDQVGFYTQTIPITRTAQRICDGDGPNDGYNWVTTGGGTTWMVLPPSLGTSNCLPDAAIAKDGPAYVGTGGGDIDYILRYEMLGGIAGHSLVITDNLPAGVTYVAYSSLLPVTLTSSSPDVVFDAGSLAGLTYNIITLTANVPAGLPFGTRLTNTVELDCPTDPDLSNNQDSFTTIVVGSETSISKAGPTFALPGYTIAYTLTYTVEGDPAQGVVLTDTLPGDVTYISDTAPVTPIEPTPGTWVWTLGSVAPGSHSFVVYGLISTTPVTWTLHNEAEIDASNDTDPSNNDDFADTDLPIPIYEIQHVDVITGTSPSPYVGQHVYVFGVVTAGSWAYPSAGGAPVRYVIGDPYSYGPWQGLFVYDPDHVVTESQLLVLGGMIQEYSDGMTELYNIDSFQLVTETWPVPDPILTTTEAITTPNPQTAEPLESVLVEVTCAEVTRLPNGFGEWLITDPSGVAAQVDDMATYAYSPTLGDILTVRGVLFYAYSHFKIEPRGDADIVPGMGIIGTGPAGGAVDVPVNAVVTATFSISINPSTVTTATFYLEGPGGVQVPGTASYDAGTWTATFTPDADLANNTLYTAHATTGIESVGGAALCEEYIWSFTTVALPEPDLRDSSKLASVSQIQAGGTLTYTIRLLNTGDLTASAVLTDIVPAEVTVLTPTLPPGMVYVGGQLLWSGEVYPGQTPILLPFQVQVDTGVPTGTTIVNVVWIDDGVHLFTKSVSVQVTGVPDIVVTPLAMNVTLAPGQNTTRDLTIANVGQAELFWLLSEVTPASWLSEDPTFGQVPVGGQSIAVVTFDATGLAVGTYTATLDVNSTDPDEEHVYVDVTLVVTTACVPVSNPAFTWLPTNPQVNDVITFQGSAEGLSPITFTWTFGDGGTGAGAMVQHAYTAAGNYAVVMTATNCGGSISISHTVVVTGTQPPMWEVYLPIVMKNGTR